MASLSKAHFSEKIEGDKLNAKNKEEILVQKRLKNLNNILNTLKKARLQ